MTTLPSPFPGPGTARPRATMRDVAALAGVSLKTVSRVVNGENGVSVPLVERVERAAEQLDFRPNLGARSLRRSDGKTATIGVILENLANPFSGVLHRAIEDVARSRGVAVLAGSIDETAERERELVAAFSSRRVDGLIMMPTGADLSYLLLERRAGVALVFVDRPPRALAADVVLADNRVGAAAGTAHLLAQGHRRVAFLGDLESIVTEQQRCSGYLDALRDAGVRADPGLVVRDLGTMAAAEAATHALLHRAEPPTALFSAQNLVTIGVIRALRRLGRQHEVAVVGFDDFLLADLLEPAVTVVAQDPQVIGRLAAEQLFRRIDGDASPFTQAVVPTVLVPRGSGEIRPA
jgi:LacI family transcriptional regulator